MTIVPRGRLLPGVALTAALVALSAMTLPAAGAASSADLVLRGRGFGHGVGMTHDGALALGRQGRSAAEILQLFYPGTTSGSATLRVRVLAADVDRRTPLTVTLPGGGTIRSDRGPVAGLPVDLAPGATLTISTRSINAGSTSSAGASVVVTAPGHSAQPRRPGTLVVKAPQAVLVLPRTVATLDDVSSHRGLLRVLTAAGRLRAVVHLDVEDYLRGMGEVRDSAWPAASLQTQAVAARSYAVHAARYAPRDPDFDLYSDDRSQIYLGASAEYAAMDRAVRATSSRVLRYDGMVANTVYSTNGGGITATATEGFGPSRLSYPYLAPVRYPTADPDLWTVRLTLVDAARRLRYPGRLTSVAVVHAGPSGRVLRLRLTGSAGPREISGLEAEDRLRLRSTLFDVVRPGMAVVTPRAPAAATATAPTVRALPAPTMGGTRPAAAPARGRTAALAWLLVTTVGMATVAQRRRDVRSRPGR